MAKSKRKTSTASKSAGVSTKKKKDDTSCAQHSKPGFDDLCDNTLLRILSYTDDLRSLISLTRCTSKSIRRRFDLKGDKNTPEYSKLYKKFWQGVFADLQMTPLEESDGKSQDYIAAINYRLRLFNNLIGHEKRRKAGTNRSYSLPLRQYNLKRLFKPWSYRQEDETRMIRPFALLSNGTGQEYVIVEPYLTSVGVYTSVIERAICLDKSVQTKRETSSEEDAPPKGRNLVKYSPIQVLLNSYRSSIESDVYPLDIEDHMNTHVYAEDNHCKWDEYFGNDTPFGPYDELPPEHTRRVDVKSVKIDTYDSMGDERIVLKEKRILLCRLIGNKEKSCTEYILWGDSGSVLYQGRSQTFE